MRYGIFGENGILNGRYDSSIHEVIPSGAVELTDYFFFKSINDASGYLELIGGNVAWTELPPTPLPIVSTNDLIAAAHARINTAYGNAVNAMTDGYPDEEIASWINQEREARAWVANNSAPTPWLDGAVSARGITKSTFAAKIIENADLFAPMHGALTGKRQLLRDQIDALVTPGKTQLDNIQW